MLNILLFLFVLFFDRSIYAQEPTSSYVIQIEQVEASPEAKMNTLSDEVQNKLEQNGYAILPSEKDSAFTFSISDTNLDFSDILKTHQKTNSTLLKVTSPESFGYEIMASLQEPFKSSLDETIPQTTCDAKTPCAAGIPNIWVNDTNGWGFHLSGPDVVSRFSGDDSYEVFDGTKQMIFSQNDAVQNNTATKFTIKTQVPDDQKEGNYTGVIKLIAIPKL